MCGPLGAEKDDEPPKQRCDVSPNVFASNALRHLHNNQCNGLNSGFPLFSVAAAIFMVNSFLTQWTGSLFIR